jgi:hypothetical protein
MAVEKAEMKDCLVFLHGIKYQLMDIVDDPEKADCVACKLSLSDDEGSWVSAPDAITVSVNLKAVEQLMYAAIKRSIPLLPSKEDLASVSSEVVESIRVDPDNQGRLLLTVDGVDFWCDLNKLEPVTTRKGKT